MHVRLKLPLEPQGREHRDSHQLAFARRKERTRHHLAVRVLQRETREIRVQVAQPLLDGFRALLVDAREELTAARLVVAVRLGRRRGVHQHTQFLEGVDGARVAREQEHLKGRLLQHRALDAVVQGGLQQAPQPLAMPERRRRRNSRQMFHRHKLQATS